MRGRPPPDGRRPWTLHAPAATRTAASHSLADLYERYFDAAFEAARRYLDDDDDANDVAQTIFLRLWSAGPPRIHRRYAKRFFVKSATNLALDAYARGGAARATMEPGFLQTTPPDPAENAYAAELRGMVREAIRELPPRCRAVATLRYDQGMTCAEIARAMGIREKSVEKQLARGRRLLIGVLPLDEIRESIRIPPGPGGG